MSSVTQYLSTELHVTVTRSGSVSAIVLFCLAFGAAPLRKIAQLQSPRLGPIVLTRASHGHILVPMVTALLLRTVTRELTEPQCIRTNQKFATCPPSQKKKWPKSAIFGNFLDFCPLRNVFCPLDAPTKNFLVPPLHEI